jgi:hypothetical protein
MGDTDRHKLMKSLAEKIDSVTEFIGETNRLMDEDQRPFARRWWSASTD